MGASSQNKAVVPIEDGFRIVRKTLLERQKGLARVLGDYVDLQRYITLAVGLYGKRGFEGMDPNTFTAAVIRMASLALDPAPELGQVFLIPYKEKGVPVPTIVLGYHGVRELAYRTEMYANIFAEVVYASEMGSRDLFDYARGSENYIVHRRPLDWIPAKDDRIVGAYAVATDRANPRNALAMRVVTLAELNDARSRSASYRSNPDTSPWTTDEVGMKKKTALLRLGNELRKGSASHLQMAMHLDDRRVIDIEAEEAVNNGSAPPPSFEDATDEHDDRRNSAQNDGPPELSAADFSTEELNRIGPWLASKGINDQTDFQRFLSQWSADKATLLEHADQFAPSTAARSGQKPDKKENGEKTQRSLGMQW